MGEQVNAKLSAELVEIDSEIGDLHEQMQNIRKRIQLLQERREKVTDKITNIGSVGDVESTQRWDTDEFPWSADAQKVLENKFKLSDFRPLQRAAINAVMHKEDAIVMMSTGGGKSLCYQLPALLSEGMALVVSPLISLIEDQIQQLSKLGIEAATLNASTSKAEMKRVEDAITNKDSSFRLLYVTPEKLARSKRIMNKLEKSLDVGFLKLIAIDEVHCCSQWGHDFRPDYKFLHVLKRQFKCVPLLGLTATATGGILEDVKQMLGIKAALVFRSTFNRPNLRYEVHEKPASDDECIEKVIDIVKTRFENESGIIYCFSRSDCVKVATEMSQRGISAKFYHANMEPADRTKVHERWLAGKCQIIVATVAFGMGIDKPDVRFVIHHTIPKSIENYYQESGRAGRDGQPATCILLFRMIDMFRQSTMVQNEQCGCANLYDMVRYATDSEVCRRAILGSHFDGWDTSSAEEYCKQQCDVCSLEEPVEKRKVDVTNEWKAVAEIVQENSGRNVTDGQNITANKLAELLTKRSRRRDRKFYEALLIQLLLDGQLQERFHFTPYSVISYIVLGPNAKGKNPVMMSALKAKASPENATSRKRKAEGSPDDDDVSGDSEDDEDVEEDDIVCLDD